MTTNTTVSTVKSVIDGLVSNDQNVADAAFVAYEAFDRGDRIRVRSGLDARMKTNVRNMDLQGAMSVQTVLDGLTKKAEKPAVDPKVRVAEKVAILRFAANALMGGAVTNGDEKVTVDESDIPEMTDELVEKAMKFATVTIGTKTRENDIPSLIRAFFATVEIGTFVKVSDIRKGIKSVSGVETDSGWDGRINAALFPRDKNDQIVPTRVNGVEAVRPGHSAYSNVNGAIKVVSDVWDETDTEG